MKKLILSLLLLGAMPLTMLAQDDVYFVPTKERVAKENANYGIPSKTYYSGCSRSVDEYNRIPSATAVRLDSLGNDIIDFSVVRGVYPDSAFTDSLATSEDYALTRQLTRFDDYTPAEAYWEGYRDGTWASPWFSNYYWNDWYYWNDPWYYGYYGWSSPWYHGWYYSRWSTPWYYGYYGYPYYGYYGYPYYTYYGYYGHGWAGIPYSGGTYRDPRPVNHRSRLGGSNFAGHRGNSVRTTTSGNNFGGSRSTSTRNNSNTGYSGGNTFNTGHGGGSTMSGSRSGGGGGGFGGGRSASGGRSFGGRR